jgi:hypothetical protein
MRRIEMGFVLALLLLFGVCQRESGSGILPAGPATLAAAAVKDEIIGTWRHISRTVRQADGSESFDPKYGPYPVGYITYDRTGYMSVQFMRPDQVGQDFPPGLEVNGDELTLIIRGGKSPEGKPVTNFRHFTRMN